MNEQQFWNLIDLHLNDCESYEDLKKNLCQLGKDEIISFKSILMGKLVQSCSFPLLAANFVISSYVSDDGFKEFRAWLISKGENRFLDAVNNPETIASWLKRDDVDAITGEALLVVADDAYEVAGGDLNDFMGKVGRHPDPKINMDWPENKAEYENRYPILVKHFWNQNQIRELHS